jgi:prolyl-tRNA synthetase
MVVSSESERFIADINTDFPEWYQDVVRKADLAESSPVAGCMTIKPYGYALWENMVRILDDAFKESGHQNLYFPALIPESYLQREAEHVEGFAPECAYVTHGGGKELEERLVFRPTSETIIWQTYARWIESYRDLPLLYNQWANVMRWEMRPRLFLRTREFLWQEGHTAHATQEDAIRETLQMVGIYRTFVEESLALPVYMGEKSAAERFAGAVNTYAIEAMMKDRKAIQAGTSHFLGQNFAKAFDVTFQNERGEREYVWGTSWGVSTRLVGTVVMGHGDEKGLSLPPRVAPIQVVIVPIYREDSKDRVMSAAAQIAADCRRDGIRVKVDERVAGQKEPMPLSGLADTLARKLGETQRAMYAAAEVFRAANTHDVDDYGDLTTLMDQGAFVRAHWCEGPECEAKIKADTTATIRCIPEELRGPGKCVVCGADSPGRVIVAKAY